MSRIAELERRVDELQREVLAVMKSLTELLSKGPAAEAINVRLRMMEEMVLNIYDKLPKDKGEDLPKSIYVKVVKEVEE